MGLLPSPFNCIAFFYLAIEIVRGPYNDLHNPCCYDRIRFNLPGSTIYDPCLPWVIKWNGLALPDDQSDTKPGAIAGNNVTYVDDLRATGFSAENAWQVGRRYALRLQYLGIQDAPQKRRPQSKAPGAWDGSVIHLSNHSISKSLSLEKWIKGKQLLATYQDAYITSTDPTFDYKQMQSNVGFFLHQAMTFSMLMPHLKGFFLTMNAWRPNWDAEGWKMAAQEWIVKKHDKLTSKQTDSTSVNSDGPEPNTTVDVNGDAHHTTRETPKRVKAVPQLRADVDAMVRMFHADTPDTIQATSISRYLR
ncbi:hypothetical protein ACA910_013008 [Epithemia clementina (nom. ined.)]